MRAAASGRGRLLSAGLLALATPGCAPAMEGGGPPRAREGSTSTLVRYAYFTRTFTRPGLMKGEIEGALPLARAGR